MPPKSKRRPRVGIPYRTTAEEKARKRGSYEHYLRAVQQAGGEPVEVSLLLSDDDVKRIAATLDAIVLPGSGADVDPRRYEQKRSAHTAAADPRRERTDDLLLDHALAADKPVLAICYGTQLLNVHLHGTLVQDIPTQLTTKITHQSRGRGADARHAARIESARLRRLAGGDTGTVRVNSSHHQSILDPGKGLRVAARAADGVIEAVEWTGGPSWIMGVQWHPERMPGDRFAKALFRRLIAEAQKTAERK